jgi:sugar phosphate permease
MKQFKTYRWILFGTVGALYFLAHLHRVAPTVIARDLAESFNAEPVVLGIISSSYFYLYAVAQPIVGYLSDSVGPRKIITVFFTMAAAGAVIFGLAPNATVATIGRGMVGFGVGGVFIPGLKLFTRWYHVNEFAVITGLMLTLGGLGGLCSAVPLTYIVMSLGWRTAFVAIGFLSLALAVVCWAITRDRPEDLGWPPLYDFDLTESSSLKKTMGMGQRMGMIFGNSNFWMITIGFFFTGGVLITFQGLWAVPYLMDVFHLKRVAAGSILMFIPLGFALGGPSISLLTRKLGLNDKTVIIWALVLTFSSWVLLWFLHDRAHLFIVAAIFFLFGVAGGGSAPMLLALTRELFPPAIMGTATGLTNMASFVGAALYQPLTGYMLQQVPVLQPGVYSLQAYRSLLIFFMLSYAAAILAAALLSYRNQPLEYILDQEPQKRVSPRVEKNAETGE